MPDPIEFCESKEYLHTFTKEWYGIYRRVYEYAINYSTSVIGSMAIMTMLLCRLQFYFYFNRYFDLEHKVRQSVEQIFASIIEALEEDEAGAAVHAR